VRHFEHREGCLLCFQDDQIQPAHPGDHLVQVVAGGRASCPMDEWDDLLIREELLWVALEAALDDAGWDVVSEWLLSRYVAMTIVPEVSTWDDAGAFVLARDGVELTWLARTDEHLREGEPTVDVICTLRSEPVLVPA
jgi:hypothetical protein